MLKRIIPLVLSGVLVASSLVCTVATPSSPTPTEGQGPDVQATLSALQATQTALVALLAETSLPPATVAPIATGSISGNLSYPSEFIPPLRVVAFNADTQEYIFVDTQQDQGTYQIDNLPPGTYHVVAYFPQLSLGGGYSQAVPCGLSVDCPDHSLIDVEVKPGEVTAGINPGDWYAPEGTFPPMPNP